MKTCPYCAEEIQDAAIVCKHCGRDLTAAKPVAKAKPRVGVILLVVGVLLAIAVWIILSSATDQQRVTPAQPPVPAAHGDPIGLTIQPDGLSIENRADGALEQCVVQILGGWSALVPIIPARTSEFRNFLVLFDSEDHEFQAHVAGKTFEEFVLANAKAKTSVACQDINGHRVTAVFHQ